MLLHSCCCLPSVYEELLEFNSFYYILSSSISAIYHVILRGVTFQESLPFQAFAHGSANLLYVCLLARSPLLPLRLHTLLRYFRLLRVSDSLQPSLNPLQFTHFLGLPAYSNVVRGRRPSPRAPFFFTHFLLPCPVSVSVSATVCHSVAWKKTEWSTLNFE